MNAVVLGSGGREHALAYKLSNSPLIDNLYTLPGNAGTPGNVDIKPSDFAAIKEFCLHNRVELVVVGPEQPLADGIVNYFAGSGIKVFGPDKDAARLESSKVFAKEFMRKYKVPTADYASFSDIEPAREYLKTRSGGCVIKYDGLAAGKGVFVCSEPQEAQQALYELEDKYGSQAELLIEELLRGDELSIMAFTDGQNYQILLPSQDHKQLNDGDKGPNTGGMGAYCPVDFCSASLLDDIKNNVIKPAIDGLKAEEFNYKGVLYFGLMLTAQGPKVLEFNVRLGDPETEVVLPSLKSDLAQLILACFDGSLKDLKLQFHKGYFIDVVLVSGGYPGKYQKGHIIKGLDADIDYLFQAGTAIHDCQTITCGGRVLNVVASGSTLAEAIKAVYDKVGLISFKDMYFRKDIGSRKGQNI